MCYTTLTKTYKTCPHQYARTTPWTSSTCVSTTQTHASTLSPGLCPDCDWAKRQKWIDTDSSAQKARMVAIDRRRWLARNLLLSIVLYGVVVFIIFLAWAYEQEMKREEQRERQRVVEEKWEGYAKKRAILEAIGVVIPLATDVMQFAFGGRYEYDEE